MMENGGKVSRMGVWHARKVWGQKIWIWVKVGHGKGRGKVSGVNGVVWMCVDFFVAATRRFI